jgi:hypothetical protein
MGRSVLLDRYDVAGQEIVFEAGDIPTVKGEQQSRFRMHTAQADGKGSVEISAWPLNSMGWPDGREMQFTVLVATFKARRTHR